MSMIYKGKSERYQYVYYYPTQTVYGTKKPRVKPWCGRVGTSGAYFETEHEAAKYVDRVLIKQGKEPVNVLRKMN